MRPHHASRPRQAAPRWRLWLSTILVLAAVSCPALELELLAAMPIDGLENAQPSGLTLVDGQLFAVSDKHDHAICRIQIRDGEARIEPFITFNAPWSGAWSSRLDFEGIAFFGGSFYLVSESAHRVLHVNENGGGLDWVTPNVEAEAQAAGLFGDKNARIEGIAVLGPRRFLLAAEREPRGLIEVWWEEGIDEPRIGAWPTESSIVELPEDRPVDFTDLHVDGGGLYALVRNADAITPVSWSEGVLEELDVWSFRHVTEDPRYAYEGQAVGRAEGLTMDDERVYVVLDNNEHPRLADETDRRAQLLVFRRPD